LQLKFLDGLRLSVLWLWIPLRFKCSICAYLHLPWIEDIIFCLRDFIACIHNVKGMNFFAIAGKGDF
jgi:hypothetical protein